MAMVPPLRPLPEAAAPLKTLLLSLLLRGQARAQLPRCTHTQGMVMHKESSARQGEEVAHMEPGPAPGAPR